MLHTARHSRPAPRLMGAETLVGDSVVNEKGENLGKLKEIMLDTENGQVAYAVLSVGGFLGFRNKLFVIPWGALRLDTAENFILNIDKELLENAPGFDKNHWPE
jgi:Uncharacterized conserved protein